jgi:hypothetical protein
VRDVAEQILFFRRQGLNAGALARVEGLKYLIWFGRTCREIFGRGGEELRRVYWQAIDA